MLAKDVPESQIAAATDTFENAMLVKDFLFWNKRYAEKINRKIAANELWTACSDNSKLAGLNSSSIILSVPFDENIYLIPQTNEHVYIIFVHQEGFL